MISFRNEPSYETIYDGKWLNNEPYAVLHRMAVSESYRNQGVAQFILNELEIMSLEKNLLNIRVDTHVENLPMRKLLTKNGYLYCGTIDLANGNKRIAFQKQLNTPIHS
jgi:RimJ/RimL family protein N-acetyltransferase